MVDKVIAAAGFDARQLAFLSAIVDGNTISDSEMKAGYAKNAGYPLLRTPAAQAAIEAALRRKLSTEAAPVALRSLISLARSSESERIRVDAAKILLDRAGFVPPTRLATSGDVEKQLTEMSQDELHDVMAKHEKEIDRLEAELAARAVQVNAPNQTDTSQEASKLLD